MNDRPAPQDTEADGLDVTLADLAPRDRYKLLCGVVIPRPIALVTTLAEAGHVNAAPFSFFNVFSEDPPLVVLGLEAKGGVAFKDTTANIRRTNQFVVNLVSEDIAEAMNVCAIDYPPEMSEIDAAGFTLSPSRTVAPPSIAESPVALECRRYVSLGVTAGRELLVGEVVHVRARPGVVDPETLRVDLDAYRPVGRLFGDLYTRVRDVFAMKRETYDPERHGPR